LVEAGADKEAVTANGGTPLHVAACEGHVPVVKTLFEAGADKEAATSNGYTPLNVAACEGHVAVVAALVEAGADKEASSADGGTPLHQAAYQGHVEVVTALVALGADIGALTDGGETPLQVSIRRGHHHVARVLRGAMALERSARTKKEAEANTPTQQAIDQAERNAAPLTEEEERDIAAQRKVRDCSTLTLAELHGTRLDGVSFAHGLSAS
jgi:ankyrin repeat protein